MKQEPERYRGSCDSQNSAEAFADVHICLSKCATEALGVYEQDRSTYDSRDGPASCSNIFVP